MATKNIKITTGGKESPLRLSSGPSDDTLILSRKDAFTITIPASNTLHVQQRDSNTCITISPIQQDMENASISSLSQRIVNWANSVYPDRTQQDVLVKFLGEVAELFENPSDPLELADLQILLLDLFHMAGVEDPTIPTLEKAMINEGRQWKIDPKTRIMNHVTQSETSTDSKPR